MEIIKLGSQPSVKGPEDWFTGSVRINYLFQPNGHRRVGDAVPLAIGMNRAQTSATMAMAHIATQEELNGKVKYMPPPDAIFFDSSDSEWHFTFEGAFKSLTSTYYKYS